MPPLATAIPPHPGCCSTFLLAFSQQRGPPYAKGGIVHKRSFWRAKRESRINSLLTPSAGIHLSGGTHAARHHGITTAPHPSHSHSHFASFDTRYEMKFEFVSNNTAIDGARRPMFTGVGVVGLVPGAVLTKWKRHWKNSLTQLTSRSKYISEIGIR